MSGMNRTILMAFSVCIAVGGCAQKIDPRDIQGEWVTENAFFYLNVTGDSLSYWGTCLAISPPIRNDGRIPKYIDLSKGYGRFQPVVGPAPYKIGRCGELIVSNEGNTPDTLGLLFLHDDSLSIGKRKDWKVKLFRMREDSSIHLQKIQFSASGGLDCEAFDLELTNGNAIFVEHHRIDQVQIEYQSFRAPFAATAFAECQAAVRKFRIRTPHPQYEKWIDLVPGHGRVFGVAVFFNDSIATFIGNDVRFPPALSPIIKFLDPAHQRFPLKQIDTTTFFHSRLPLPGHRKGKLEYLQSNGN